MWYQTTVTATDAGMVDLVIDGSNANGFMIFFDDAYMGNTFDALHAWPDSARVTHTLSNLTIKAGQQFVLNILSSSIGITNGMNPEDTYTAKFKGIVGNVTLGTQELVPGSWICSPFLEGERRDIMGRGHNSVSWSTGGVQVVGIPRVWYSAEFTTPTLPHDRELYAVMLNASSLGRGHVYINGQDIGRYWNLAPSAGALPTQQLYQIPQDWFNYFDDKKNLITIFEEIGATSIAQVGIYLAHLVKAGENESQVLTALA